jgi:hypothetical protein
MRSIDSQIELRAIAPVDLVPQGTNFKLFVIDGIFLND